MKIYVDLLFLINWWLDFLILLVVKLTLKRNIKIRKVIFGSFFGAMATFLIFFKLSNELLFFFKMLIGIIMVLISFNYKNFMYTLNNYIYLFMTSFILGGFLLVLKNNIQHNFIYLIILIIITPIFLWLFYWQNKNIFKNHNLYYQIKIFFDNLEINLKAFLDTGNKLRDPITKKFVILVKETALREIVKIRSPVYVPIKTINGTSLIDCYKPDYILINNMIFKNYLIGCCDDKNMKNDVDCLLNNKLWEDL